MTRADEWHIKVDTATKRRLKAYAALQGLTLAKALAQLLDLATNTENSEQSGTDKRPSPDGKAA